MVSSFGDFSNLHVSISIVLFSECINLVISNGKSIPFVCSTCPSFPNIGVFLVIFKILPI